MTLRTKADVPGRELSPHIRGFGSRTWSTASVFEGRKLCEQASKQATRLRSGELSVPSPQGHTLCLGNFAWRPAEFLLMRLGNRWRASWNSSGCGQTSFTRSPNPMAFDTNISLRPLRRKALWKRSAKFNRTAKMISVVFDRDSPRFASSNEYSGSSIPNALIHIRTSPRRTSAATLLASVHPYDRLTAWESISFVLPLPLHLPPNDPSDSQALAFPPRAALPATSSRPASHLLLLRFLLPIHPPATSILSSHAFQAPRLLQLTQNFR